MGTTPQAVGEAVLTGVVGDTLVASTVVLTQAQAPQQFMGMVDMAFMEAELDQAVPDLFMYRNISNGLSR